MRKNIRRKSRKYSQRFRIEHKKIYRILSILEISIQKIGEILKIFQLDGIHHIVDQQKHILERYVTGLLWKNSQNLKLAFFRILLQEYIITFSIQNPFNSLKKKTIFT